MVPPTKMTVMAQAGAPARAEGRADWTTALAGRRLFIRYALLSLTSQPPRSMRNAGPLTGFVRTVLAWLTLTILRAVVVVLARVTVRVAILGFRRNVVEYRADERCVDLSEELDRSFQSALRGPPRIANKQHAIDESG